MQVAEVPGRIYKPSKTLDTSRRYLTDAMTPAKLAQTLKSIDDGDLAAIVELNEEMEAKDAWLQGVASRRREAITALEWYLEPDLSDPKHETAAKQAAEYCEIELRTMRTWKRTLEHLSTGVGPGIAVVEKIWSQGGLAWTSDIPGHRLKGADDGSPGVYIYTDREQTHGVFADAGKFVIYTPQVRAGFPANVTITRALAYIYLIKHYSVADWATFSEKFGMPVTVGWVDEKAPPAEKDAAEGMLKNLAADFWALFSKDKDRKFVDIEFKEAGRATEPFSAIVSWCERQQSVLYLGQTLTTDVGSVGSFAAAKVHDNVKASILLSDMNAEAGMIREGFLRQMVMYRWPGKDMPVPFWKRRVIEERNLDAERVAMEKIAKMKEWGLPVDDDVIYEQLGLPMPVQPEVEEPDSMKEPT